jgi:hypothetical protein
VKLHRALALIVSAAACGLAAAATQPASAPSPTTPTATTKPAAPQRYSDRYSILSQRNIFLKDRSRGSSSGGGRDGRNGSTTQASSQPSRRPIEESMVLTGIVEEGGQYRAYVEDQLAGAVLRVSNGERLAHGRVARIGIDSIEYEPQSTTGGATGGQKTVVAIGSDLTGREVNFALSAFAAGGSSSAAGGSTTGPTLPSGVEGLNPNDPSLTMEQRLKLRRAQELKK